MVDLAAYGDDVAKTRGEFYDRTRPAHVRGAGPEPEPEGPEPYWAWAEIDADRERHQ